MEPAAPPTVRGTVRNLTLPLWVLLIGTFVNTVGSFLLLFLTLYLTHKGLSVEAAGLALGAWGIGRIVGAFVGGAIADRLGYRSTMAASMLTSAIFIAGMVGAASQRSPWLVIVTALVAASVSGIWRPPAQAMMAELTPPEQLVMVTAFWRLAFNGGMLAAPVLGAFLSHISYDLLFWVEAGSSALFGLFVLVGLPADRRAQADAGAGSEAAAGEDAQPPAVDPTPATANRGYVQVLTDRRFVLFLVAMVINAAVYIQAPTVLSVHLASLGYRTEVFGSLASLNALMVICLEIPLTKVTQRFPARTMIALGMALTGAGLSLYSVSLGLAGLILATVVWTMGEVTGSPSLYAYPGLVAPPALRGRYIATATVANQAGYSLGPMIGTAVFAHLGGQVFWLCGVVSVVAVAATLASVRILQSAEATRDHADRADSAGTAPSTDTQPAAEPAT